MSTPHDVLDFWFVQHGSDQWFGADPKFDDLCASRFGALHEQAARGELFAWRETLDGLRAEIILLDQFSRQLHRGSPKAFAQDLMALTLAQHIVAQGLDQTLTGPEKLFVYLPYMHSESLLIQEIGIDLFSQPDTREWLEFQQSHRDLIARFGRFPKRNAALGRVSTAEEIAYISEDAQRMY